MSFLITKYSGETEPFDIEKFKRSLHRAGASEQLINQIAHELEQQKDIRDTAAIYRYAFNRLKEENPPIAARYNLKHALMELGPDGYPFEYFIAHIFQAQGYDTQVSKIVHGRCVAHELDVVARKDNRHLMIECKFHNEQGLRSDVKVPLYIKARFDDVKDVWIKNPKDRHVEHEAWVATNTKFTSQAIEYANCVDIKIISWSYPENNTLPHLIKKYSLHPITALTSLTTYQKRQFIKEGLVLCRDAENYKDKLKKLGMTHDEIEKLVKEAQAVCAI